MLSASGLASHAFHFPDFLRALIYAGPQCPESYMTEEAPAPTASVPKTTWTFLRLTVHQAQDCQR
jgi:hypothetical protein